MRISFVGGGVMGEAIIKSLLTKGVASQEDIVVSDISPSRRDLLKEKYNVKTIKDNRQAVKGAKVVLLAIKPQDLTPVLRELGVALTPEQLVLSIVAGATIDTIYRGLDRSHIVRAMPNMAAQISEAITVWTAAPEVSQQQKELARSIFTAFGKEIYVVDEKYVDMATALSGSGPAYVFLVIEALVDAGVHIGLPREIAEKLVLETVLGSAHTIQVMDKHPAELRSIVTSPGGTTAEGLLQLEKGGLRSLLIHAVIAAYEKAKTLGTKES